MGIFKKADGTATGFATFLKSDAAKMIGAGIGGAATLLGAGKIVDMVKAAKDAKMIREDKIADTLLKNDVPVTSETINDVKNAIKQETGEIPVVPVDYDGGSTQTIKAKVVSFLKKYGIVLGVVVVVVGGIVWVVKGSKKSKRRY